MSDKEQKDSKNNAGEAGKKTLSLKGISLGAGSAGVVRSSRSVVVEKRNRKVLAPKPTGTISPKAPLGVKSASQKLASSAQSKTATKPVRKPSLSIKGGLTDSEASARERVLREASLRQKADQEKFTEQEQKRS